MGVHGVDSFAYQVTDCMGYGSPETITVELPSPSGGLESIPFLSFFGRVEEVDLPVALQTIIANFGTAVVQGTFSLYELMMGVAGVLLLFVGVLRQWLATAFPTSCFSNPFVLMDRSHCSTGQFSGHRFYRIS